MYTPREYDIMDDLIVLKKKILRIYFGELCFIDT